MNKVKELDRQTVKDINSEIESALKSIEKKFGVKVELGNTRFSNSYFTTKVKVATVSEDGVVKSKEAVSFERQVKRGNISEKYEVGGRIRTPKGETFIIDGYNTRARKYPVKAHNRDRRIKMSKGMLEQCEVVEY